MDFKDNNIQKVKQYWDNYNNSSLPRCYNTIGTTITDKIDSFTNTMYVRDPFTRITSLDNMISLLFDNEVQFVFRNRKAFLNDTNISLSHLELFNWMKGENPANYGRFKHLLRRFLLDVINDSKKTDKDVYVAIRYVIYYYLTLFFIKL